MTCVRWRRIRMHAHALDFPLFYWNNLYTYIHAPKLILATILIICKSSMQFNCSSSRTHTTQVLVVL